MVQILAGEKGEGKTKILIDLANESVSTSDGDVIYIDDDKRHIYDLNHKIRFVEVSEFPLANYRELIGFIYGIFSQNSDITKVFVDGIFKIVQSLGNEDLIKLVTRLDSMSKAYNVDFVLAGNVDPAELPKEVEQYIRK
ncbi:MAG: twitching motility protein PilT [Clostridia bacterium]|jgi:hypothetical protein|nr:twitching motility protein PilT [Clostridia bacterium]